MNPLHRPVVAEKQGIPWASTVPFQPFGFFSAYDPPGCAASAVLGEAPILGPAFHPSHCSGVQKERPLLDRAVASLEG